MEDQDLFGDDAKSKDETPDEMIARALETYNPVAKFVGFSGGNDSMAATHWMMNNVDGCKVFHLNTGIGIERTREFVRETCADYGWPLVEIRALEDCGSSYEDFVLEHGFPGPWLHRHMYNILKDRAIALLVKRNKTKRKDKVLIATGIYKDESNRRSRYSETVVRTKGAQLWVAPLYHWSGQDFYDYKKKNNLPTNPVSAILGMSGECLCGAYAHKGEKALVKLACPKTFAYLEDLEKRVWEAGHHWGWEGMKPEKGIRDTIDLDLGEVGQFCTGCGKGEFNANETD